MSGESASCRNNCDFEIEDPNLNHPEQWIPWHDKESQRSNSVDRFRATRKPTLQRQIHFVGRCVAPNDEDSFVGPVTEDGAGFHMLSTPGKVAGPLVSDNFEVLYIPRDRRDWIKIEDYIEGTDRQLLISTGISRLYIGRCDDHGVGMVRMEKTPEDKTIYAFYVHGQTEASIDNGFEILTLIKKEDN